MTNHYGPRKHRRKDWKYSISGEDQELELEDLPLDDEEVELEEEEIEEDLTTASRFPSLPKRDKRLGPSHCLPSGCRYPIWERKVRLIGEARIDANDRFFAQPPRLEPLEVVFTSPPTLNREIIICGFVTARLLRRGHAPRRVALPFQATFTAWPIHDQDIVVEDFLCFAGSRVCPILATSPDGRVHRAFELKVAFDALVRVFHPLLYR